MTIRLATTAIASTLLLVGCAGEVGSADDAAAGWAKTNVVLQSGGSAAQGAGAGATSPDQNPTFRAGTPVSVNYEYSCPNGGSIAYNGNYYIDAGMVGGGANVEFNYEADLKKCKNDGLTIDGTLDYAMSVETTDTSSSVVYSYDGDLVWSGDVSGACVISMKASVSATAGVGASVSYEGSICGYDAAATLNVQI
ncbi:MAG: hypothetical protein H6711_22700 [Myxococcales bacterium]|nr:hypothetical protein [Myxococcales bacterium]